MTIPGDPLFDETDVENRIKNLWMQLQLARSSGDPEPLKPYFSAHLYSTEENKLRDDLKADRIRHTIRPVVLRSNLTYEGVDRGQEKLACHMVTRTRPEEIRRSRGKTVAGGEETFWREEWILTRPAGSATPAAGSPVSVSCPGCGSPLSLYKSAKCPFCGSLVPVSDFTWKVERIDAEKTDTY